MSEITIYERDIKEATSIQEKPIKILWALLQGCWVFFKKTFQILFLAQDISYRFN